MRRILVALDGTALSAAILGDAVRLAGPDGELILMHAANRPRGRAASIANSELDTELAREYLDAVGEGLRTRGVSVTTVTALTFNIPAIIEETAQTKKVDMIACATHGRGGVGRLLWGSVAWKVVANSPVPVLLRHPVVGGAWSHDDRAQHSAFGAREFAVDSEHRRILVPLDGSPLAERAVPLAQELAAEWYAPIDLVRVVPDEPRHDSAVNPQAYLDQVVAGLPSTVRGHVLSGIPAVELVAFAQAAGVTDVVMTSHGRTGLDRVFMGSVTHDIIHRLSLPVIVIPALAAVATEERKVTVEPVVL